MVYIGSILYITCMPFLCTAHLGCLWNTLIFWGLIREKNDGLIFVLVHFQLYLKSKLCTSTHNLSNVFFITSFNMLHTMQKSFLSTKNKACFHKRKKNVSFIFHWCFFMNVFAQQCNETVKQVLVPYWKHFSI